MAKWFKRLFGKAEAEPVDWPAVDLDMQIAAIKIAEAENDSGLGILIHEFEFHEYELRLDRDITGMYRVVAMEGRERRYSFSLHCDHKDLAALRELFGMIADYLSGERHIGELPNTEMLKGHFYGHVEM
ncbi:hypothetical protein KAR48_11190 [bacterium]|nr:hypothetical protein [bacterium]